MESRFRRLEDVVLDEAFPDVDLALRRGRHIDRDDEWYGFLIDGQDHLEALYRRFGCELVHKTDGYFYLLPTSDKLGKRLLSVAEMLVGQALTLLYLDPTTVEQGGLVTREQVTAHLASVMGTEALVRALNPKRKRYDERVAEETARGRIADAIRRLAALGFVQAFEDNRVRLRPSLLRFAEPVRGSASPEAALERLVAAGEIVLTEGTDSEEDDEDEQEGGPLTEDESEELASASEPELPKAEDDA
jgi:chromosome partition protein MukE